MSFQTPEMREKINKGFHEKQIWTRFGTVMLGLWLIASPETFGYIHEASRYVDWIAGLLLLFFGFLSMNYKMRAWIWGGCAVGVLLQFAPLAFWAKEPVIYLNQTLIGVLAIAFCVLVPLRPKELELGPLIPPGWSYNPSAWLQRMPVIFFAIISWFISRYLASYQLGYIDYVWDPFFGMGTQKVITSMISQEFPVSDAGMGALAYSLEAILGAKGGPRRWHTMPWLVVFFGILVVPVGFVSIVLVMLQPIAVGAWCGLCLIIAACMLMMLALSVDEVVAVLQYLRRSKREGKSLWKTFWYGSSYAEEGIDPRTPVLKSPLSKKIKSMFWGITVPWNLALSALCGIWLLFAPQALKMVGIVGNNTDVCGALIAALSIISFAEVTRAVRFVNILLALWLAIGTYILPGSTNVHLWHNIIVAVVVILLSLIRGKVKEHYGTWDRLIR